jgi:hypothetical protein
MRSVSGSWRAKLGEYPGALYHVIKRGNQRQKVFYDDRDRTKYLELLSRADAVLPVRWEGFKACDPVLVFVSAKAADLGTSDPTIRRSSPQRTQRLAAYAAKLPERPGSVPTFLN